LSECLLVKPLLYYLCGKLITCLPPFLGFSHYDCSLILFPLRCKVNWTHDHKSCVLWGTTGTVIVWRSELWTVSKCFAPEKMHLICFRRITHFSQSNSNSQKKKGFRVIKYFEFLEVRIFWKIYCKHKTFLSINLRLTNVSGWQCHCYTVWQLHSVAATQCDSYTVWQLHSVADTQCET
jgi:hypothetical protein